MCSALRQLVRLWLPLAAVVSVLTVESQAARLTALVPGFPSRQQWLKYHGYCGEVAIQSAALTHGVWVSEQKARDLGALLAPNPPGGSALPGELLLSRNLEPVLEYLGFKYSTWDYTVPTSQVNLQNYMVWVKQQLIAGNVVIFSATLPPTLALYRDVPDYDHIMPFFGIVYDSMTAQSYDDNDILLWDYLLVKDTVRRAIKTPGFYAPPAQCSFDTGCVPTGVPNHGTAMGGLRDSHKLYLPLELNITAWSDFITPAWREPQPNLLGNVSASYQLNISSATSGIAAGQIFTIVRCDGEGSLPQNPSSNAAVVKAPKCKPVSFTMGPDVPGTLNETTLGPLWSYSVVYFVALSGN